MLYSNKQNAFRTFIGPSKNERIAYELSLQEIAVFYSGHNPMQAFANYLDSVGLIGFQAKGLVPGVDCPNDATFMQRWVNRRSTTLIHCRKQILVDVWKFYFFQ
jgi:hypothetical protein